MADFEWEPIEPWIPNIIPDKKVITIGSDLFNQVNENGDMFFGTMKQRS